MADQQPKPRGRARSSQVASNPLDCPITPEEQQLARLRNQILIRDAKAEAEEKKRVEALSAQASKEKEKMNYQNYIDSPGAGPGQNPRQAPPSPSPGMPHANGMNGAMGIGGGMVGYPTPAGHQSDLNYVMSMVEELSAVLRTNQQLTAGVVDKMGKVREKAQNMNLNNDEMIAVVASELNGKSLPSTAQNVS